MNFGVVFFMKNVKNFEIICINISLKSEAIKVQHFS